MAEHFISIDDAGSDLLAAATYLAEDISGSDDRAEAIAAVVPRYLARGEVDLAADLANSVDDPHVRDRLLINVAQKCAETDDDEYALQLADAIEEYGLQSQARETIALAKAQKGDFAKAREIIDSVAHPDRVLAGIAVRQAESGDEEGATQTLSEIDYPASSVAALLAMAAMRIEREDTVRAAEYLETAGVVALEIEHDVERIRMLVEVAGAYVDAGRKGEAIGTLEKARGDAEAMDSVQRDGLLASVSLGFLRAGSVDLADRTLDAVADKTQMATVLLGFARDYWQRGEKDEAIEALDEANDILRSQRESETRDSKAKFALFGTIAAQYAGFQRGERAIEVAESIEDDEQVMLALGQVARILTTQGNDEQARQALNAIAMDQNRSLALIGMSDAAAKEGNTDKAKALLDEAAALIEEVPQMSARSAALGEIVGRFVELGDIGRAGEIASVNIATISEIRGESTKAIALANLAGLFDRSELALTDADRAILREAAERSGL